MASLADAQCTCTVVWRGLRGDLWRPPCPVHEQLAAPRKRQRKSPGSSRCADCVLSETGACGQHRDFYEEYDVTRSVIGGAQAGPGNWRAVL